VSVTTTSAPLSASSGDVVRWIFPSVPASVLIVSILVIQCPKLNLHPLPDPGVNLIIPLGTSHTDLHTQPRHSHHDLIDDIIGISDPRNLLAFQVGEGVDRSDGL